MQGTLRGLGVRTQLLLAVVLPLYATGAHAQAVRETARSQSESGLTLVAEVFCSETSLRTGNVRVRWSLSSTARSTTGLATLAGAKQSLDTTVFKGGFDKGLYVSMAVPGITPLKPVPPIAQAAAQTRQTPLRAYQIQLVEVVQPRATPLTAESGEIAAVIENLEPGVNYTWRVTVEAPKGRTVSAPVTVAAPTCTADMIEPGQTPRRRP